jgi:serine/threonine protein kinase
MTELLNNRYRVLKSLGRGGSGQTFLAEDTHLPSAPRCVIKQLKPISTDPGVYRILKERFDREASILEKLGKEHPQIPTLQAYFAENKEFYLVQDWIDGRTLTEQHRDEGPATKTALCKMLSSLLSVLEFVHKRGMIHRDIKPDNVMIRASDGEPVLIDFGAVKEVVTASIDSQGKPTSSVIIGTPGYMPLEQLGGHPVFSSDLYSLGLTAIFLLTGKPPQEFRDSISGELNWHQLAGKLDPNLVSVLDKATKNLAHERYQSASEMNAAIRNLLSATPIKKIQIPVPERKSKGPFTSTMLLSGSGLLLVLLLLIVSVQIYRRSSGVNAANDVAQPSRSSCVLYNDDPTQQAVNVRANCDKKSCDQDPSTILKEYPNNTMVRVNREVKVKARKDFYWTQIVIVESGEIAWAASSKIRCN